MVLDGRCYNICEKIIKEMSIHYAKLYKLILLLSDHYQIQYHYEFIFTIILYIIYMDSVKLYCCMHVCYSNTLIMT